MEGEIEGHELFRSKCIEPYQNLKKKNPDTVLFFRKDDCYEIYFDDACIVSKIVEIPRGEMFVYDLAKMSVCIIAIEKRNYSIGRLLSAGWKVAICEKGEGDKNGNQ